MPCCKTMANTRELRRRIKSIKNTSQITKAMQMVAATKMRRAQVQATNGRPYSENLIQSLARILSQTKKRHPLLGSNNSKNIGVLILSTDKGLVGALNTNLIRLLMSPQFNSGSVTFYTVGKKGRSFVARSGKDLKADFENNDKVTFRQAKQLAKMLMDSFKMEEISEVYFIYPAFVSTLRQEAKKEKLLPIDLQNIENTPGVQQEQGEFLIEPNAGELLDDLLTHYVEMKVYQALLETKASEHSARMIAMQNATNNAKELVSDLTLTYNQTRQANITTELLEITTAQVAMS